MKCSVIEIYMKVFLKAEYIIPNASRINKILWQIKSIFNAAAESYYPE